MSDSVPNICRFGVVNISPSCFILLGLRKNEISGNPNMLSARTSFPLRPPESITKTQMDFIDNNFVGLEDVD